MKKVLTIACSFLCFSSFFAQYKSGIVDYGITAVNVPLKEGNIQNDMVKSLIEIAKSQKFELKFNSNSSSFIPVEVLNNEQYDANLINLANIAYSTSENYFIDLDKEELVTKKSDGSLIKSKTLQSSGWEISIETKTIDSYVCYKANYNYEYIARGNQIKTKTITAWFAPSLPFSYGPIEFHSLPGLILELNKDYTTYSVHKIVLFDEQIKINIPSGKIISIDEYKKAILKN